MTEALVFHGPRDLRLESRPLPTPSPGEVVVRVLACGVCGTDLRIFAGGHPEFPPGTTRVPGHEIAATAYRIGAGVTGVAEGDYLFIAPNIGCGRCLACRAGRENRCLNFDAFGVTRDGGFADYMVVPEGAVARGNLLRAPAEIEPWALTVVEPLAAVLRGQKACRTARGDFVVVCGSGPIGLLHVLVAKVAGAEYVLVSEPSETRRKRALAFGADDVVDPMVSDLREEVFRRSDGLGADVVIVAAPSPSLQSTALGLAALGGRVLFFGGLASGQSQVELDTNLIHYRELVLTGTTGNTVEDCSEALALVSSSSLDPRAVVTACFPLSAADDAFAAAAGGEHLKVVLVPHTPD
jgi:L-iditol 2-dehydrogenase